MELKNLGSEDYARTVLARMFAGSTVYRSRLCSAVGRTLATVDGIPWSQVPVLTKKSFYAAHPWREIVPQASWPDVYSVLRSSGTTSSLGGSSQGGFFWPQLKSVDAAMGPEMEKRLAEVFELDRRKTLVVIGLSLGSWAGGEQFSFLFKSMALKSRFPLVVFSPGNQHSEILEIIERCHDAFDQVLIALCPSAIYYLETKARAEGVRLPIEKISFVVTGEPFPETMRATLATKASEAAVSTPLRMLSIYGSADTGVLGAESPALIGLRQLIESHRELSLELGFGAGTTPNLYHAQTEGFLELIDGQLVITKWQGIPLVRYNLEDKVRLLSWARLCEAAARHDLKRAQRWQAASQLPVPDVMAVYGRNQGCVFLCGSNIFESMLVDVVERSRLLSGGTETFHAWVETVEGRQVLCFQFEMRPGLPPPPEDKLYRELVDLLGEVQPEFKDDYERFYRALETDGLRILRFHFCESPRLSRAAQGAIKRKVLIPSGPV